LQEAAAWLVKGAASGDPEAKMALAVLHLRGDTAIRNPARAEELLREAAEQGHSPAMLELGHYYAGKYGTPAQLASAIT
jgi:TPR repeat protein